MNQSTAQMLKRVALSSIRAWANSQNENRFAIGYSLGLVLALDAASQLDPAEIIGLKNEIQFLAYNYGARWNKG